MGYVKGMVELIALSREVRPHGPVTVQPASRRESTHPFGRRWRQDDGHYNSLMAPWRTVICVTGSPELFNSVRIWSFR